MASAVDSRLAYARLSAVATASRLPTANRGSNNSYTTSWDTTNLHVTIIYAEHVDTGRFRSNRFIERVCRHLSEFVFALMIQQIVNRPIALSKLTTKSVSVFHLWLFPSVRE